MTITLHTSGGAKEGSTQAATKRRPWRCVLSAAAEVSRAGREGCRARFALVPRALVEGRTRLGCADRAPWEAARVASQETVGARGG